MDTCFVLAVADIHWWQMSILEDDDGGRREEIAGIGGSSMFSTFYDRLKEMRDYYRHF